MTSTLQSDSIFTDTVNVNNWPTINAVIAEKIPIAAMLNGMAALPTYLSNITDRNKGSRQQFQNIQINGGLQDQFMNITFSDIHKRYQFLMYKNMRPKVIFAHYTARVLHLEQSSQINTYYPHVTFKIDYDPTCVGSMMLLTTLNIQNRDTYNSVNINGFSSAGSHRSTVVPRDKIQSVQFAYGTDFFYNYLNYIRYGFANTGGSSINWHEEVPIEIAKYYHDVILDPGQGECVRRLVREDVFQIMHDPYHPYGDWAFQLKQGTQINQNTHYSDGFNKITQQYPDTQVQQGNNEIGLYWVDTKVKQINMTNVQGQRNANTFNVQIANVPISDSNYELTNYGDGSSTGKTQVLKKYNFDSAIDWMFGTAEMQITAGKHDKNPGIDILTGFGEETVGLLPDVFLGTVNDRTQLERYTCDFKYTNQQNKISTMPVLLAVTSDTKFDFGPYIAKYMNGNNTKQQILTVEQSYVIIKTDNYGYSVSKLDTRSHTYSTPTPQETPILTLKENIYMVPIMAVMKDTVEFYVALVSTITENVVGFVDAQVTTGGNQLGSINLASITNNIHVTLKQVTQDGETNQLDISNRAKTGQVEFDDNNHITNPGTKVSINFDGSGFGRILPADTAMKWWKYGTIQYEEVVGRSYYTPPATSQSSDPTLQITGYYNTLCQAVMAGVSYSIKEDIVTMVSSSESRAHQLSVQASVQISDRTIDDVLIAGPGQDATGARITGLGQFMFSNPNQKIGQRITLAELVTSTISSVSGLLIKATGAASPYLNVGNVAYTNIEINPFKHNDFMLNGLYYYTLSDGSIAKPYSGGTTDRSGTLGMFTYNAAILRCKENEEFRPAIVNVDYMSIHTYRESHGVVDFYFPLSFLFAARGIENSFPHYACAAQSIMVKFEFCNPLPLINTMVCVDPMAIDQLDFSQSSRVFINRVRQDDILVSQISDIKFVLFYERYAWIPELMTVLANYRYYFWVTKNYQKHITRIRQNQTNTSQHEVIKYKSSLFYTQIHAFFVNESTIEYIENNGNNLPNVPIYINRYNFPIWDVLRYDTQSQQYADGAGYTGTDNSRYLQQFNSVYNLVPVKSLQLSADNNLTMTDSQPYRFQMFESYVMLQHEGINQCPKFNNLCVWNINPTFDYEQNPYCYYSPAYAPAFQLNIANQRLQQRDFGIITIATVVNMSYITDHIMLLKYSTNNQ